MKRKLLALAIIGTFAFGSAQAAGKHKHGFGKKRDHQASQVDSTIKDSSDVVVEDTGPETLGFISPEEEHGLVFMREEEKLARDVYLTLYNKWGMNIFLNIANSEQKHTDSIKKLLDKYALADPVVDDTIGVYSDYHFYELFEQLTMEGGESLEAALRVGIQIEELDIKDIQEHINDVEGNPDLVQVYENLLKGSRNHLRSFWRVFESRGLSYEPQFISDEHFDEIVNSPMEPGRI